MSVQDEKIAFIEKFVSLAIGEDLVKNLDLNVLE